MTDAHQLSGGAEGLPPPRATSAVTDQLRGQVAGNAVDVGTRQCVATAFEPRWDRR